LPKKLLDRGEAIISVRSYDERDIDPDFRISDLPPTGKLVFDVVKRKTDSESLHCMICQRKNPKGPYATQLADGQLVTNLRTDEQVYALRLALEKPQTERDYQYVYQI
jgi:hypothetical protein